MDSGGTGRKAKATSCIPVFGGAAAYVRRRPPTGLGQAARPQPFYRSEPLKLHKEAVETGGPSNPPLGGVRPPAPK